MKTRIHKLTAAIAFAALILSGTLAQAGIIMIDTFDMGTHSVSAGVGAVTDSYTGPGPIGGKRLIYARNASSQIAQVYINGGGSSNPGEYRSLAPNGGGANRQVGWGQSPNDFEVNWSGETALNQSVPDNTTIEVDFAEIISLHNAGDVYPQVRLYVDQEGDGNGAKRFEYNLGPLAVTNIPQTVSVDLSTPNFATSPWAPGDLQDIDGIRLLYYDSSQARITEIRFNDQLASTVPEPSSLVLFIMLGLVGLTLALGGRRNRR